MLCQLELNVDEKEHLRRHARDDSCLPIPYLLEITAPRQVAVLDVREEYAVGATRVNALQVYAESLRGEPESLDLLAVKVDNPDGRKVEGRLRRQALGCDDAHPL